MLEPPELQLKHITPEFSQSLIFSAAPLQGRRQKKFQGSQWKKQDRKIAPLSLSLLYQFMYENPGETTTPPAPRCRRPYSVGLVYFTWLRHNAVLILLITFVFHNIV